ncbi:hypothetical protein E6H36_04530 [Candidatus Bathyarchaeota archaeon]|nr:MAG: hypothetical protein E6H36_04530 [Candidatus Bathyarchaeota archaeon]
MTCRFILSEVVEDQVADDEGYSIFEPTLAFEINRKNAFHALGIEGRKSTVTMPFREEALEEQPE